MLDWKINDRISQNIVIASAVIFCVIITAALYSFSLIGGLLNQQIKNVEVNDQTTENIDSNIDNGLIWNMLPSDTAVENMN